MLVLLHVILAIVVVYACGIGLVGILHFLFGRREYAVGVGAIVPVVGYAFSQLLFSFSYSWFVDSRSAALSVILIVSLLMMLSAAISKYAPERWRFSFSSLLFFKSERSLLLALVTIIGLASWAYIALGEGHYFHSGNEDFFDAIEGGESYLQNTPWDFQSWVYTGDIRLQYSSQAFWRIFMGVGGMDAFALQSILNLALTVLSIYWLVRYVFDGSSRLSATIAFCCVGANFYFTTFLAGHVGSMMYLSVAPALLGLLLAWGQRKLKLGWLLLAALLYGFIALTYPGPFNFLLIPLVVWLIHERLFKPWNLWRRIGVLVGVELTLGKRIQIQWRRLWKLAIFIFFVIIAASGLINSARAFIQDLNLYQMLVLRTNVSWLIAFEKEIWVIFWGLIPSNLVGSVSFLPIFVTHPLVGATMFLVAMILSALALFAAWTHRSKLERQYLFLLVFLYPAYYLMMVKFWGSPYYAYKFLYTNFFVVVIALGIWLAGKVSPAVLWKKVLWLFPFVCLIVVNLFWDVSRSINIMERPYHQKEKIADFIAHTRADTSHDYAIDIPDESNTIVFSQILQGHRLTQQPRSTAKYLVQLENFKTVAYSTLVSDSVIYSNGLLRMIKRPASDDILIMCKYGTDHFYPWKITWVGNEVTHLSVSFGGMIDDALRFINTSGNQARTYVDIRAHKLYSLIQRALTKEGMTLQLDPSKSTWFLRQRFTRFTDDFNRRAQRVFQSSGLESIKYQNRMFEIVEVPLDGRIASPAVTEDVERTTIRDLIQQIRQRGDSVYLDMPPYELESFYMRQTLLAHQVVVVDTPVVALCLRLTVPGGLERYNFRSIMHPEERRIWKSPWQNTRIILSVGMELLEVPLEGRLKVDTRDLKSVRYWYLRNNEAFDFFISLSNLSYGTKYLRILAAPGPGIDFGNFNLLLRSMDERILTGWPISGATVCVDLPLTDTVISSRIRSVLNFEGERLIGHSLLPADERLLNYGLLAVELTDRIDRYSDQMLAALNPRVRLQYDFLGSKLASGKEYYEIIDEDSKENLWVGTGWYSVEMQNEKPFRWVNNEAQFVVRYPSPTMRYLNFEVEQGPSLADEEPIMQVIQDGHVVDHFPLSGNCKRKVRLSNTSADQSLIVLRVDKVGHKISGDPRKLDFRVFRAYLSQY